MKKIFTIVFAVFFLHFETAFSAGSDWHEDKSKGAKARLIASFYQDASGTKKLIAGIHFKLGDGWKIYGNDAGGIGMPPSLDFSASKNFAKENIVWPKAEAGEEKIGDETIKFVFYKNEVVLPIEVELQDLAQATELTVKLDYGLCKDVCIPVSENFTLKVSDEIDQESLAEIQKFLEKKITATKEVTTQTKPESKPMFTLLYAILLAIFGGAILNIMPCVLPVLSIKLISVIKHSNARNP